MVQRFPVFLDFGQDAPLKHFPLQWIAIELGHIDGEIVDEGVIQFLVGLHGFEKGTVLGESPFFDQRGDATLHLLFLVQVQIDG